MAFWHDNGGDGRRIVFGVAALQVEPPRADGAAGGFGKPLVAREDVLEAFLVDHVDRFGEAVQQAGRRRVGEIPGRVHRQHVVPREVRALQPRCLHRLDGLGADRRERQAGRQHHALLRAGDGDVDAPLVVTEIGGGEAGNRIDHQQRRMADGVHRFAHLVDARAAAGRRLVVDDADGLDFVRLVGAQLLLDQVGVGADAPVGRNDVGIEPELGRHLHPEHRELPGLAHQDLVAGRQRVGEAGFPGAGAGRRVDDDVRRRLEQALDAGEHAVSELLELETAMVENLPRHRREDSLRHRRRAGDLQEMAAGPPRLLRHRRPRVCWGNLAGFIERSRIAHNGPLRGALSGAG